MVQVIEFKCMLILDELVECCVVFFIDYQNVVYVCSYCDVVEEVWVCESILGEVVCGFKLSCVVVIFFFKFMVYKDEYEVVCFYIELVFCVKIVGMFEGDYKLCFYLVLLLLVKWDDKGYLCKQVFGSWMMLVFGVLVKLCFLWGMVFDFFGYIDECRQEWVLISEYCVILLCLLVKFMFENLEQVVVMVCILEEICGYGYVKECYLKVVMQKQVVLLVQLEQGFLQQLYLL